MKKLLCILLAITVYPLSYCHAEQSAREKRHAEIRRKLKEHADLPYPYFAPSVHIRYHHPDAQQSYVAYYNEVQVKETVAHTYFCTIGFDVGYLGIQDHRSGPIAIFSVWDKAGGKDNSREVAEADRTQVLLTHKSGKSSRFGGEGSGAKTMLPYPWKTGETYCFLVSLTPLEMGTIYTAWIAAKGQPWERIASYRTVVTRKELRGFYSFIEDYVRNGKTGQSKRIAYYPFQAALNSEGDWQPILSASGTIADDLIQNGHSGVRKNIMYSQSGADTAEFASMPKEFRVERKSMPDNFPQLPEGFQQSIVEDNADSPNQ